MPFSLWLLGSSCLVVVFTAVAIGAIRSGESPWRVVRTWVVQVWDILTGGG